MANNFLEALQRAVILSKGPCFIGQECPLVVNLPTIDPDLELTVDFGDGSDPVRMGNLSFILNTFQSTTGYSCILRHGIDTGGEYLVKATANTELKPGVRYVAAFSTTIRIKCSVPGLKVTRLSPEKLEQIARNETLVFHVKLIQNCTTRPVAIEWSLFVGPLDKNESVCLKDQKQAAEAEIKILPYTLHPGLHHLKVMVIIFMYLFQMLFCILNYHHCNNYYRLLDINWAVNHVRFYDKT